MEYVEKCTGQTDLASRKIVGKSTDLEGKSVAGWGKKGEQRVGLDMLMMEDGVGWKEGKVVVVVVEAGWGVED